jgi:broad specificity phosphatase PhoE
LTAVPAAGVTPGAGPADVLLVRPGETDWSRSGRHTGRTDQPLNDEGRQQAVLLGPRLAAEQFGLVLVSPLQRAAETAELAGVTGAVYDPDLVEWDYGEYEGRTTDDIRAAHPGWMLFRDGAPGGESAPDVGARADRALAVIRAAAGAHVLVVAHGHLLRVLTARWSGLPAAEGQVFGAPAAASVALLGPERESSVVRVWNDTSHLAD